MYKKGTYPEFFQRWGGIQVNILEQFHIYYKRVNIKISQTYKSYIQLFLSFFFSSIICLYKALFYSIFPLFYWKQEESAINPRISLPLDPPRKHL